LPSQLCPLPKVETTNDLLHPSDDFAVNHALIGFKIRGGTGDFRKRLVQLFFSLREPVALRPSLDRKSADAIRTSIRRSIACCWRGAPPASASLARQARTRFGKSDKA